MMPAETIARSFRTDVEDGVAICLLDVPGESVNTLSQQVGAELSELLRTLARDSAVKAVVIASGKKDGFVAGANIEVIRTVRSPNEAELLSRTAQGYFDELALFPKPVLAAIHGACLGGGLELALACTWRIATAHEKTQLGTPEVLIGLIPGAGGTQRLPRLIGIAPALDLILTGKSVRARKAKALGLVDEVVPEPILLAVAKRRALELASGTLERKSVSRPKKWRGMKAVPRLALEKVRFGRGLLFREARRKVLKKSGGHYPAPQKALEAVKFGLERGLELGLEREARLFGELAVSEESKRLVDVFFATTALKKDSGVEDPSVKPRKIETVAILGGGLMGSGIAFVTAGAGRVVRIREKDGVASAKAFGAVSRLFDERVKRHAIDEPERLASMRLVTATADWSGFGRVDLVVEAVFEDLSLKQEMVRAFEKVNKTGIFASNTSSIPIARIGEASSRPESVIGMHYFSPVQKMPLLEVIKAEKTAPETVATAVALGKEQGKTVIVVNDGPGFYTTRILMPYITEAVELLFEGARIEDIDGALVAFGMPVGPVILMDEVGIDVCSKISKVLHQAFGDRMAPPKAVELLVADGRQGRKSRKGFYTYGRRKKVVDTTVYDLLPHGQGRSRMSRDEIAERVILQMVNEAIRCLGDGILRSPRDGDVGAIFGLGFPPFLGGPFRYADAIGAKHLLDRIMRWHDKFGERFEPAPLLVARARSETKFYS
ncbi:MAG TPA: fatty acid oxidation complex subunit alpha FadJ [Anaeromyxobacteraceae bacterium]|nr:fatty acid oxidation complex subunit alpha FadJ [Anaeromyxobacteraceae bacterium]